MDKLTKNDIKRYPDKVCYCASFDADSILKYHPRVYTLGYNAGIYGHNWRAYRIMHNELHYTIVLVGYRNFIGERISTVNQLAQLLG